MTKRIISLLMAIMLVIGVFAIQAAATSPDEGIEPHGPVVECYNCGAAVPTSFSRTWEESGTVNIPCIKDSGKHPHDKIWRVTGSQCPKCGAWTETNRVTIKDSCSIGKV